jgi:hypothetical protein
MNCVPRPFDAGHTFVSVCIRWIKD